MSKTIHVRFTDVQQREAHAREQLRRDLERLEERKAQRKVLSRADSQEHDRLDALRKQLDKARAHERVDPLFVAMRDCSNTADGLSAKWVQNQDGGELRASDDEAGQQLSTTFADVTKIAFVLGALAADEVKPPRLMVGKKPMAGGALITVDPDDPARAAFAKHIFAAVGEANAAADLAELVLSQLEDEGDSKGPGQGAVDTVEFVRVVRKLVEDRVTAGQPGQLRRKVNEVLDRIQDKGLDRRLSAVPIKLPNVLAQADFQIQEENVRLCAVPIYGTMFEELKVFQVVDKLVELAQNGTLPVSRGRAGEMLYRYWKDTATRMSESERRNFYAQTIGVPGGAVNGGSNREFNDLWLRFISSVSSLVRQFTADELLTAKTPMAISQQQVRKAARDLAMNLSSHAYGMALYFAIELQQQIQDMIELLKDPEIRAAYGARDMWQVIDQVATLELGGARNTVRYSTLATCGAIITAWLANNVRKYNRANGSAVIDLMAVLGNDPPSAEEDATSVPTDYDLVNACELWLVDTATSEDQIEEMASRPRLSPAETTRPVPIPGIARELIEQGELAGLGLGMAARSRH